MQRSDYVQSKLKYTYHAVFSLTALILIDEDPFWRLFAVFLIASETRLDDVLDDCKQLVTLRRLIDVVTAQSCRRGQIVSSILEDR